jgi:hypothetical protein
MEPMRRAERMRSLGAASSRSATQVLATSAASASA